ncbi:MAG TPA: hypothetical protein DDW85_08690 [Porphyromonadaceae bacterium]|jgi:hypothetical protein|nr:hypothetical protein [Porphyromonadaceae bacterium]
MNNLKFNEFAVWNWKMWTGNLGTRHSRSVPLFLILIVSLTASCYTDNGLQQKLENQKSTTLKTIVENALTADPAYQELKIDNYKKAVRIETLDYETGEKTVIWDCIEVGSTCDPNVRKKQDVARLLSNELLKEQIDEGNIIIENGINYILLKDKSEHPLFFQQTEIPIGYEDLPKTKIVDVKEYEIGKKEYTLKAVIDEERGMLTCPEEGNDCRIGKTSITSNILQKNNSLAFNIIGLFESTFPEKSIVDGFRNNKYTLTSFKNGFMIQDNDTGESLYIKNINID